MRGPAVVQHVMPNQIPQQNMNIGQQQTMNMAQSPMLPQSGLTNQSTMMNSGLGGQQQINQPRATLPTHSRLGPNARTSLSGQVQMVNPAMHGVGPMQNYNRTMGIVSNQGMGINFQGNNPNSMPSNSAVMTNDSLEKYVTSDN